MSKPTKIILDKQSDLILTNAQIVGATGIVKSDLPGLVSDLANLDTAIQTEATTRSNEISTERARIDAILNGSDINLDQFREVVAFVQSIDMTNDDDLLAAVTNINSLISAEELARIAGDDQLSADLATLQSYVDTTVNSAIDTLTADLSVETSARIADVDAEESRAMSAELVLTNNLSAEESRAIGVENYLSAAIINTENAISTEVSARIADVDAEESRATAAELSLTNALSTEVSARTADVDAEESRATAAEASLASTLSFSIDNEQSARIDGDQSLQNQIDFITSNIDAASIDSLTEIVAAFQSADGDINGAITTLADAAAANLSTEVARATSAESTEAKARLDGDLALGANLSSEVSARIADVDAEQSRAMGAESELNDLIDAETSIRLANDTQLTSDLSAEASRAISTEVSIFNQIGENLTYEISVEASNRVKYDVAEASIRLAADSSLESALSYSIDNEQSARIDGDQSLQNQIDFITSNVDAAAIDSLTEIVSAFQSADGDINNAITTLADAAAANLSTEVARATSAESTEAKARLDGDLALGANLSSEVSARIADVDSEESRATSAEASLASKLNVEASIRLAADISLESNLSSEVSNRESAISAEASTRLAGDTALTADLANLQSYVDTTVNTAITNLTSDLSFETSARISDVDAEENRATSAEGLLTANLSSEIANRESADSSLESFISSENSVMSNLVDFRSASLESNISVEQSRIDVILEGSDVNLDQFAEIVTYINNLDLDNDNAVLSSIVSLELAHNTDTSIEVDLRIAGDANLQSEINAMASTDDATLEIDAVDNVIRLKEVVSAPLSGVRTFEGDVKAGVQPDTLPSYDAQSFITKGILDVTIADLDTVSTDLSTEVLRATAAEAGIQEQLDAMPSTDNTTVEIDSENNVIRLTETISAPLSGVRTFVGDVKASVQPDTLEESYDALSYITKGILDVTIADLDAVSTDLSTEALRAEAVEASLQAQLDVMPSTDDSTLEVNGDTNVIKLKDTVAAPASGVRTFEGDVKAGLQPDTLESYDALSYITKGILDGTIADLDAVSTDLSTEVSRAQSVEAELDVRIVDIISNTNAPIIDSFTEVVDSLNSEIARAESAEASISLDFTNIYSKKVAVAGTPNGVLTIFTLALPVRIGSEMIYVNGLLMEEGEDYTTIVTYGKVSGVEFLYAPISEMKVKAFGVCGLSDNV